MGEQERGSEEEVGENKSRKQWETGERTEGNKNRRGEERGEK